ncbi:YkgJ family cysteine cluster protein [Patescibacteria group bacterium]|nr:YkgJ family cysteine cluster protein [Patescibacteria group bacterium]
MDLSEDILEKARAHVVGDIRALQELIRGYPPKTTPVDALVRLGEAIRQNELGVVSRAIEEGARSGRVSTCLGCREGYCCSIHVDASLLDAVLVADFLDKAGRNTPEFRDQLHARYLEEARFGRLEWFDHRTPCLFLESGSCSVYPARPMACVMYYVVGSPVELCASGGKVHYAGMPTILMGSVCRATGFQHLAGFRSRTTEEILVSSLAGAVWSVLEAWPARADPATFRRRILATFPAHFPDEGEQRGEIDCLFPGMKVGGTR